MSNVQPMTEREYRLIRLPWISVLTYEQKLAATKLIKQGIDITLLHHWHNVVTGCYKNLPPSVLTTDIERMRKTYPQFDKEILSWNQTTQQ